GCPGTASCAESGARVAAITEESAEEVGDVEPAGTGRLPLAESGEAATGKASTGDGRAQLVVLLALGLVANHAIGLGDLLEPGLCGCVARLGVGVELLAELAVGLLDRCLVG